MNLESQIVLNSISCGALLAVVLFHGRQIRKMQKQLNEIKAIVTDKE